MTPYQRFGKILHSLRRSYHVTTGELCGALEIDQEYLALLESGVEQAPEDIVEQLVGYFALDDSLADNMWVLAGYPIERVEDYTVQPVQLPMSELKASYTDMVHVSINNYGVTMNFMQNIGTNNQPIVVSRLGMSRDHAKSIVEVLTRTLNASEQHFPARPRTLSEGKKS
jgi:transcriptional regulator with XRE-family HTH domain